MITMVMKTTYKILSLFWTVLHCSLGTLRQVTTVTCDGWIDARSRKTRVTFYRRPSGTVCFRWVSRREDNGEDR